MRGTRIATGLTLAALAAALLAPASSSAAGGPTAVKSGALINYVSTGKLKIAKRIRILAVCSANCNVTSQSTLVGPGPNFPANVSGPLTAGVPGGPFFQPSGGLLKAMKANPGRYKIRNTLTATNPLTGAVDTITNTFRLKR